MTKTIEILHIEDNEIEVKLILHELKKYFPSIQHRRVERPDELEEALKEKWDVILCDFTLPEFDGLTALSMVREKELNTPFILVSGRVEEDIAAAMMRLGANDYVMKDNLKRLAPAILRELKIAEERAAAGLKPVESSGTGVAAGSSHTNSNDPQGKVPVPAKENAPEESGNADFIKARHKAVVNILYAANLIRKTQQAILLRQDLSETQFNILSIVRRQAPKDVTINMIKEEITNATIDVSRTIEKMVKAGLLNYSVNPQDKRMRDISIAPRGLEALAEIDKFSDEMFLSEELLSEEQSKQINLGLQQMLTLMRDKEVDSSGGKDA